MATITQFPKSIQPAFNPILLKLTTTSEKSETIYVTINSKVYTLTKESFDNVVVFDLSFLLRKHVNKTTPVVAYSVNYMSNTYNFSALNAVKQIGESTDMTSIKGKFLTLMPFVRHYEGFTTQIVFYQFTGQNQVQYSGYPPTDLPFGITTALVPTSSASKITIIAAGNSESIECINSCVPESPFYVRWINQLGGFDYWMFGKRQEKALSIFNLKEYNPFFEDSASVDTNRKLLSRESSRIVEVGAEMIKDNEFDELIKILLSPEVEYYNGSKWVPISITNQEVIKTTSNAHHSIALEFELPNPILQTNN